MNNPESSVWWGNAVKHSILKKLTLLVLIAAYVTLMHFLGLIWPPLILMADMALLVLMAAYFDNLMSWLEQDEDNKNHYNSHERRHP